MGDFTFNGISAAAGGLVVERIPSLHAPAKRLTAIEIPGRNGDLHYWDGSYQDYTQSYQCWFKGNPTSAEAHKIKAWLMDAPAGARLEDTYAPDVYRLATVIGPIEIQNIQNKKGRFTVNFKCAPQSYLKVGEQPIELTGEGVGGDSQGTAVINPSREESKPLIIVRGSVSGTIGINGKNLLIMFPDDAEHELYIDTQEYEAWEIVDGARVPCNAYISDAVFEPLRPGLNMMRVAGGLTSATVYPRWWRL